MSGKISGDPLITTPLGANAGVVQGGANKQAPPAMYGRGGNVLVVTSTGATAVPAGTTAVLINLSGAGSVSLTLPTVASQAGIEIGISDIAGNVSSLTLTPNGSETVQGIATTVPLGASSGQGPGLALTLTIVPNTGISGWFIC